MSTSMLLGKQAAPHVLTHEGREYHFRPLAQTEKSAYERWILGRARDVLRTLYEGEDLAAQLAILKREALTGVYDFHGETCRAIMSTVEGTLKLAGILMGCTPDEVLHLWLAHPEEAAHLLELVIAESMPHQPAASISPAETRTATAGKNGEAPQA